MTSGRGDIPSWIRGRLHMAGVDADTPISTVLDVLAVLVVEAPRDALAEWRRKFDQQMWKIRPPDRSTWGLAPDQQAAMARLAGISPQAGQPVADSRGSRPTAVPPHGGGPTPIRPRL